MAFWYLCNGSAGISLSKLSTYLAQAYSLDQHRGPWMGSLDLISVDGRWARAVVEPRVGGAPAKIADAHTLHQRVTPSQRYWTPPSRAPCQATWNGSRRGKGGGRRADASLSTFSQSSQGTVPYTADAVPCRFHKHTASNRQKQKHRTHLHHYCNITVNRDCQGDAAGKWSYQAASRLLFADLLADYRNRRAQAQPQ